MNILDKDNKSIDNTIQRIKTKIRKLLNEDWYFNLFILIFKKV